MLSVTRKWLGDVISCVSVTMEYVNSSDSLEVVILSMVLLVSLVFAFELNLTGCQLLSSNAECVSCMLWFRIFQSFFCSRLSFFIVLDSVTFRHGSIGWVCILSFLSLYNLFELCHTWTLFPMSLRISFIIFVLALKIACILLFVLLGGVCFLDPDCLVFLCFQK